MQLLSSCGSHAYVCGLLHCGTIITQVWPSNQICNYTPFGVCTEQIWCVVFLCCTLSDGIIHYLNRLIARVNNKGWRVSNLRCIAVEYVFGESRAWNAIKAVHPYIAYKKYIATWCWERSKVAFTLRRHFTVGYSHSLLLLIRCLRIYSWGLTCLSCWTSVEVDSCNTIEKSSSWFMECGYVGVWWRRRRWCEERWPHAGWLPQN